VSLKDTLAKSHNWTAGEKKPKLPRNSSSEETLAKCESLQAELEVKSAKTRRHKSSLSSSFWV